jgi:hypothetical protein
MTTSEFAAFLAVSAPPNNPSITGMTTPTVIAEPFRVKAET